MSRWNPNNVILCFKTELKSSLCHKAKRCVAYSYRHDWAKEVKTIIFKDLSLNDVYLSVKAFYRLDFCPADHPDVPLSSSRGRKNRSGPVIMYGPFEYVNSNIFTLYYI